VRTADRYDVAFQVILTTNDGLIDLIKLTSLDSDGLIGFIETDLLRLPDAAIAAPNPFSSSEVGVEARWNIGTRLPISLPAI
jgi:hypothetical protein